VTATNATRKRRGAATQTLVSDWLREHGWPHAESAGAGRPGVDVLGLPGLSVEVKARRAFSPLAWVRQARQQPGVPIVVLRCDGQGPATIGEWPVVLRLADLTELLHAAGYGDGDEAPR
jgi:hypothetical protein